MTSKKALASANLPGGSGYRILSFSLGLLLILLIILVILPTPKNSDGFATFAEVERYAAQFDEFKVEMSGENLVKPDYAKHYASLKKTYLQSRLAALTTFLHLTPKPAWTVDTFAALAKKLIEESVHRDWKGLFIHKIAPATGGKIVVWGDISGAFHSLTRDLGELIKQGVLTPELKVAQDNFFLVFLGDVVSRSPFLMETTSLVMRLRWNNPNNVFHLRGNHESNDYWQGFGLKEELELRAAHLKEDPNDEIPLRPLVRNYFDTLPVAVYAGMQPEPNKDFIRLSHEGGAEFEIITLNEKLTDDAFLTRPLSGPVGTFKIQNLPDDNVLTINLKAIIRAEVKRKSYQQNNGLRLIEPEGGVTSWTVLSCPTEVYRKGLQYFYDAFAIIDIGPTPTDGVITLNNHDVRSRDAVFTKTAFMLVSGVAKSGSVPAQTPPPAAVPVSALAEAPLPPATPTQPAVPATPVPPVSQPAPVTPPAPSQTITPPSTPVSVSQPPTMPAPAVTPTPAKAPIAEPTRTFKPVADEVEEEISFTPEATEPVLPAKQGAPQPPTRSAEQTFDIALKCRVTEDDKLHCQVVGDPEEERGHMGLKHRIKRPRPQGEPLPEMPLPEPRPKRREQYQPYRGPEQVRKFKEYPAYQYGGRRRTGGEQTGSRNGGMEAEWKMEQEGFQVAQ